MQSGAGGGVAAGARDVGGQGLTIYLEGAAELADKPIFFKAVEWWGGERWQALLGHMSHTLALERLGPVLTRRILWRVPVPERVVALSFDDGPHPEFTPAILDVLERHRVAATFFLIGRHVWQHPQVAERLASGNHEIGNHTFNHRVLPLLRDALALHEIRYADRIIRETTGRAPRWLRPPMGLFSRRVVDLVEGCGYVTTIGDVYPRDANLPGRERIYERIMRRVRPGSIIILHDGGNTRRVNRQQTVWATERIIENLRAQDYHFVTISELVKLRRCGKGREPFTEGDGRLHMG